MAITMKRILDKYKECDKFSLTGKFKKRYNATMTEEEIKNTTKNMSSSELRTFWEQFNDYYTITDSEFYDMINKRKEIKKQYLRDMYNEYSSKTFLYPSFEELYNEIEKECYEFYDNNKESYTSKYYNEKVINDLKNLGYTDEKIDEMKKDYFRCGFITDNVGKTTKYGKNHYNFFWNFYAEIALNIDTEKDKNSVCVKGGKSPIEQVPNELKEHLLYYEVSNFNAVTISGPMINYYFKLNDESKKYLLKFRNDFMLIGLEDLTLYKDDEVKFSSCSHERFNSIECDYKTMSEDEIADYVNDEFFKDDNSKIIEVINTIKEMDVNNTFTFKDLKVEDIKLMQKISYICSCIKLEIVFQSEMDSKFGVCFWVENIIMEHSQYNNHIYEVPKNIQNEVAEEIIIKLR